MAKIYDAHKRLFLTLLLIGIFLWSLSSVTWSSDLVHGSGMDTLIEILSALFMPDLSGEILAIALESIVITVVYAVAGMSLALILAFFLGIFASGVLSETKAGKVMSSSFFRGILSFMRAIHELVWAWLFVASFGLSPYAAILALALPYAGILGRIFADLLADVPKEPIESLKLAGASKWQTLLYGYLPQVRAGILSYVMYRFECAIRSSAIMSFVGLGGIGYQIQLSLDDLAYNEVWTFLYCLIAMVLLIDLWSRYIRHSDTASAAKPWFKFLIPAALLSGSWIYIIFVQKADFLSLFSSENLLYVKEFFRGLAGLGEEEPAFLSGQAWMETLRLTWETLKMSIMAIGISAILMIITVLPAARNIADGSLILQKNWYSHLLYGIIRVIYIFSRAIPELIWAMMIIFVFKPGILPGALALALHNFGILGKLCAETIEDSDERPIKNLAVAGARKYQLLFYGILPAVLPKFLSYILYRWEVIMRTTIVVGFVGAGGLGQQFKMSMSFFHYSSITQLLLCYIVLVFIADAFSEGARKAVK
ncbi:PhnE/PtxC family ABC transporter permease [Cytobacillus gottheilii]|uniref:ABC transporter permease subunit n=1 Tax=Cytobacillus gottheilii TaxID=859144 RepID=A0ABX8FEY1_9BACI|nr:ABC transporter permease subunit [Cytobacillus gottheilii]QVY62563.1 ABC transporter permease subunit [Cytobacillus gottheilii]